MPSQHVEITDTFDMWRQKTNAMIDVVYTLTGAGAISVSNPQEAQVLVCHNGIFQNVSLYGDVIIDSYTGHTTVVGGTGSNVTKGRMRFAGSMRSLY